MPSEKWNCPAIPQGARNALARAAGNSPNSIPALTAYAEFLERYGDAGCRDAYRKLLAALRTSGDSAQQAEISRRLAALDLSGGRPSGATHAIEQYRSASGKNLKLGNARTPGCGSDRDDPGPLRSFARMAAISPEALPDEVLPALARNVVTNGYQASHSNEALEQTEYLKLVHRYLSQARELEKLAGDARSVITIDNCESRQRRGTAPHPGIPHARRLRVGSRAGNGQRRARLPDHRFRLPGERTGAGAAHQPARSPTTSIPPRSR